MLQFIEDFKALRFTKKGRSKLISLKVEENLLELFRKKAQLENVKYQTKIKELMRAYLDGEI